MSDEITYECVMVDNHANTYTPEALTKLAEDAEKQFVYGDNDKSPCNIVGEVSKAWVEDNNIKAQIRIYKGSGLPLAQTFDFVMKNNPTKKCNDLFEFTTELEKPIIVSGKKV